MAARVRIPYGLPNESGQSHRSGVALLVPGLVADLHQCVLFRFTVDMLAPVTVFRFGDAELGDTGSGCCVTRGCSPGGVELLRW